MGTDGNPERADFVELAMRTMVAFGFALTTLVPSPGPGLEPRVDAAVARVKDQIPGLSVAVVVDNRVAYAKGVGTISLRDAEACACRYSVQARVGH